MHDMESIIFTNLSKYKKLHEKKMCKIHEKYDLRKIDMEIIIYLMNCGEEDTARDIANTNMFTKGHISQSVKRLSDMGYITVTHDQKDQRVQHLRLTDKTELILAELLAQKHEVEKCVFADITEEESRVMKRIFEKMCDNIMKEMQNN